MGIGTEVDMDRSREYSIFYRNGDAFWAARCLRCQNAELRRQLEEMTDDLTLVIRLLNQMGVANPLAQRGT